MPVKQTKAAKATKGATKTVTKPARSAVAGMVVVTKASLWDDGLSVRERAFLLTEDLRAPDAAGTWLLSGDEDIVRPSEVDWKETEAFWEEFAARSELPAAPKKKAAKKAPAQKAAKGKAGTSRSTTSASDSTSAPLGYEAELWRMADALRGSMDAAEYKHVVLGLIVLKYISDSFEEVHARLDAARGEGADPEDMDEYRAENIFWVPPEARWGHLKAQARQSTIGRACLWDRVRARSAAAPVVAGPTATPIRSCPYT